MMVWMNVADELTALLDTVSDDERRVLLSRFGLDRGRPRTVEETAADLSLQIPVVRLVEGSALAKLRARS
jgi:DNA-directed RNA polymerase sigma subunit (sigma70/sigma32)